jgi:hypothetical protein
MVGIPFHLWSITKHPEHARSLVSIFWVSDYINVIVCNLDYDLGTLIIAIFLELENRILHW